MIRLYPRLFLLPTFLLFYVLISISPAAAQSPDQAPAAEDGRDFDFSGVMFLAFEHNVRHHQNNSDNEFAIKRAYITFRQELSPRVDVRFTQDVSIDEAGDGAGDIELRLKYAYARYKLPTYSLMHQPRVSFGVVDRPWINFEQDINDYRAQKSMFLDQNDFISSADYGLTFKASLGPALDAPLTSDPGRYGSLAIGLYNGGGYSALEQNKSKLLESRLSLRPLPDRLPGIQASFIGVIGRGNISQSPDFRLAGAALSHESPRLNMFIQGFRAIGDGDGRFLLPFSFEAARTAGWSVFTELRPLAEMPISITLRADEVYDRDYNRSIINEYAGGLGYVFENGSKLFFDISTREVDRFQLQSNITRYELLAEIRF